jgi:energy-coupling factor transporter ATP-binding protein EcfA2
VYDQRRASGPLYARALIEIPFPVPFDQEVVRMRGSIVAREITKSYGVETILDRVTLTVPPGARVGVLGPNGIGKSTLLRVLAGVEAPDSGSVVCDGAAGNLPQEADAEPGETLLGYLARRTGVAAAERELDLLATGLGAEPEVAEAYSDALERFLALDLAPGPRGGDVVAALDGAGRRARLLPARAGRPRALPRRPARARRAERLRQDDTARSAPRRAAARDRQAAARRGCAHRQPRPGSRALRLERAAAGAVPLVLDEPSNHLDIEAIEELESALAGFDGAVVLVTHDRRLLDAFGPTRTLELRA